MPHEAQLERLQIDHVVDGGEIEEGRDDRGESDVQIGRSGKLRDDEGRRAEDRGVICPPVEATDSTAAEKRGEYPVLIIIGMVTEPVVTVFPTEEPETIPHSAEEITATFAGPPQEEPATQFARSMKNAEILVRSRKAPKIMNTTMYF